MKWFRASISGCLETSGGGKCFSAIISSYLDQFVECVGLGGEA